jgi:hypothetical protein
MARLVMMFDHLRAGALTPAESAERVPRQATAGVITMSESLTWVKSSYSSTGNCVEVADQPGRVLIKDTKDPSGPTLSISVQAWRRFTGQVKLSLGVGSAYASGRMGALIVVIVPSRRCRPQRSRGCSWSG